MIIQTSWTNPRFKSGPRYAAHPVAAIRLVLCAITLICPLNAGALENDAQQPIHIEGDDAEIDQNNETIVYTGSVEIAQGSLRVRGDRMVVKINGNQVERIITTGSPARYQQTLEDAQGEVRAHADSIIYHTSQERIFLNGGASLKQQGNTMNGESIRYDIVKGKVDASAGTGNERVRMKLDPDKPPSRSSLPSSNE